MELDELKSQALMDARYEAFAGPIRAVYDKQRSGNAPRTTSSPFPLICIGNYLLSIDGYLEARVKEAIMFFDKAIEMDEEFCAGALVGKACCLLKGDTNWFGVNSHDFGYKEEAVKLLQKAETQIMYSMNILYVLGQQLQTNAESGQAGSHSTNLKNQLLQKVTLLGTYLNSVRNAIAVVQRSRRLLHVEWKEENDPGYTTKYDLDPQSQETQDFLLQLQTNSVDLIFNDLIVRISGLEELKAAASKGAACVTVPDKFPTQTEIVKAAPKAIGAIVGAVVSNNETDQAVKTLEKYEDETSTATIQLRLKNPSPSQLESLIKALRLLQRGQYALGLQLNFEFKSLAMSAVKKMVNGTEEFQQEVKFSLDIFGERDDEAIGALQLQTEKLVLFKDKVKNTATWKPSDFNGRDESVDPHRLRIECSTSQQVSQVLDCCMPINTFGLKIASLDLAKASTLFEEACCLKTVTLSGLTKAEATRLIPELRKVGFNFALVFKGLSTDNASKLVENSATEQEHIMLRNLKPLSECFAAQERATLVTELSEYAALGVEYLPEFSESAFIPWFHIITVCGLAAAQVAIGIGLMTFGFVRFGSGFLAEAAADLFTAYRTYTTRHFSWNSYFNQKAVSLVISIVSAGISRSVRGIQGTGTAIQTVRTGAVEFGVTKLVTGSGVKQASRGQLTKLAVQSLGVKVIEAGAREGFNKGVDTLFDYGIRFLEPKLSEKVFQPQIRALVNGQREIRFLIRKMYAIDTQLNQQLLLHSIETTIAFVTSSSLWDSIGLQLARSVLSDSDNMGSGASAAVKIVGLCNGSYEVSTLCAKLEKNLRARLEQYDNQHLGMTSLIKMATAVQIPAASASRQPSANELLRDESHAQMLSRLEQIEVIVDSIQTSETKKKLLHFFSNIHNICHAQEDVKRDLFVSTIIKTLSDRVTDKVIRVVETQMLAPWTTELVAHTVGSVSHSLQQWAHGGFTIRQVLDREAQRYWTHKARQQIQQAVLIQTNQSLTQSQLMLSKYTDAVVAGRDAGLTEITQLASKYGTRLTIVTEGDYQPVPSKRNFDSVVVCKTGPDGVTQYELHQNGATPVTYNNGFDMCGKIFGKPVGELRREIVADVPKRADAYVAALNAESWIADCYPAAAQEAILASQPLNRLSVGGTFGLPGLVTFDNLLNLQKAVPFAEAIREGINEGYAIFNPGTPEVTPAWTTEGVQATPPPQEPEGQMAEGAQALQLELEPEAAPESMPPDLDTPQPTSEADRARVLLLLALLCLSLSIIVAVGTFYLGSASVRPGQISGESFGQRFNQLEGANQVDEL